MSTPLCKNCLFFDDDSHGLLPALCTRKVRTLPPDPVDGAERVTGYEYPFMERQRGVFGVNPFTCGPKGRHFKPRTP